jgi:beta-lactam-binding protein with PASTA domain/tRNA A-37 threonylcarbamoyl transferase component Bud32
VASPNPYSLIGRVLDGRYLVLSHLADGGMATVYVALDQRLDRKVALKVMRADLANDESFVHRFHREARSAAKLSHPNVVAVYDQGEDDGTVFLAMELVQGLTLRQVMHSEGPLTARAALDIIDPVLQALGAAHSAGLIHRDVKPENVILREDGAVKVADFGLARAIATSNTTAQTGLLLGTVAYLSPEQVERGTADARSDVYATGLLLFEMLTGSKAYIGDSPIHVAYQHVHSEVPRPSTRIDTVPPRLDELVARASARNPELRPRDANELLSEVRRSRRLLSTAELDRQPTVVAGTATMNQSAMLSRTAVVPAAMLSTESAANVLRHLWRRPHLGPERRRNGLIGLGALILVAAVSALYFFTAGPGGRTAVPRVVGLTSLVAQRTLKLASLDSRVVRSFDETVTAGVVLAGAPAAGREMPRGSMVVLTISKGPERFDVPKLVGRTRAEAEQRVTDAQLSIGATSEAFNETVPQGQIISTSPEADTPVKRATSIALVVSKGRQPVDFENWTGRPADQAVAALTGATLKVNATSQEWSDTVPKGSVISQSPPAGPLHQGDPVTLVTSQGPKLEPVPDVVGKQEEEARPLLESLGFTVTVDRVLGGLLHRVTAQSVVPGTQAAPSTTITLTVV